jgi:hypothetical protein
MSNRAYTNARSLYVSFSIEDFNQFYLVTKLNKIEILFKLNDQLILLQITSTYEMDNCLRIKLEALV